MLKEGIEPYTDLENGFEENYLDRFYVDDNNLIFVAESNGDVIGFLSINNHRENGYIYLDDFCVSEEWGNRERNRLRIVKNGFRVRKRTADRSNSYACGKRQ